MRILIVSYHFPPYNSIGAVRPGKLARHWHEAGHDISIICGAPDFPKTQKLEVPEECVHKIEISSFDGLVRRGASAGVSAGAIGSASPLLFRRWLARTYKTLFHWPDGQRRWAKKARAKALELHHKKPFDLVIASVPAFSSLAVIEAFAHAAGVIIIADYRDPWTDGHLYEVPAFKRFLEKRKEANWLRGVHAITTVTKGMAAKLTHHGKPVWVVANGYDNKEILAKPAKRRSGPMRLAFTGNVYPSNNDIVVFCEGLKAFVDRGNRIDLIICGHNTAALVQELNRYGLDHVCQVMGVLPRAEALSLQADSDVGLLFTWRGEAGVRGTKVYEYLGNCLRILSVGPRDDDTGQIIEQAKGGKHVHNAQQVCSSLETWALELEQQGTLATSAHQTREFSRQSQFEKLDRFLAYILPGWKSP